MKNPSLTQLNAYILAGERATWPQLEMIRDHTRISRVMLKTLQRVEARLA